MLKGFLNHGSVIVHDLLLGTSTRVHTVSFPARRARSRRSAGHTTKNYTIMEDSICMILQCMNVIRARSKLLISFAELYFKVVFHFLSTQVFIYKIERFL